MIMVTTTWNEAIERFAQVTDKLGKKIDLGIFEAVVVLNMLGIGTTQSCEGHMGWGVPYPWIDIKAELTIKYRLHQYLSQFYTGRSINFDCALVFHGYRLRSAGAVFAPLLSQTEQEQKLRVYQQEVVDFTNFMKSLLRSP